MTPYILVDATFDDTCVPECNIDDGKIVLNISSGATRDLNLGNEWIMFSGRFNGKPFPVQIPVNAIIAIYAKENGQGMIFPEESLADNQAKPGKVIQSKPHLKVVK
jgi:stringent starvation protein B